MPSLKRNMDDNPISPGADAQSFWILAKKLSLMTERERISSIQSGFAVTWILATKTAFDLDESAIAGFVHIPAHRDRPFRLNVTACSGLT
ncbi:hypothetical protein [Halopseudomonas sp.]|uniref:hypothetical protein n=1 Tax=Halopseudomonas sp. TaxID=2901191 RepID=UPI00300397AB